MEYRIHHRLSKLDWSVFLSLKPILILLALIWLGFFLSRIYWSSLDHDLMASIWEKDISILAGNLNLGRSYFITAVKANQFYLNLFACLFPKCMFTLKLQNFLFVPSNMLSQANWLVLKTTGWWLPLRQPDTIDRIDRRSELTLETFKNRNLGCRILHTFIGLSKDLWLQTDGIAPKWPGLL